MMSKLKYFIMHFTIGFTGFLVIGYMVINQQPASEEITFVTVEETDAPKFTLLHIANFVYSAENGDIDTVKKYVHLGIDVDSQDHNLDTALMGATLNGHTQIIELLLYKNADPTIQNRNGYSTFDYSKIREEPQLTAKLVSHQFRLRQLSSIDRQEP